MTLKLDHFAGLVVTSLAAACIPVALVGMSPALAAMSFNSEISDAFQAASPLLAQDGIPETILYFETESSAVRIYRRGSDLFMNLYNKATDGVEVNGVPAEIVPSTRDQMVYKNSLGEADRFARINVQGESKLEIVAPDGTVILQEPGFNTLVGISTNGTNFQGNNFTPGTPAIVISREYANLRSAPRLGSDILAAADRRAVVDVLDRVGNPKDGFIWYEVLYNGTTGWIRGDLLQAT